VLAKPTSNTNGTEGSGCRGCPFFGDGQGFVPDELRDDAQVLVMRQNPGKSEVLGRRFLGKVGGREQWEPHHPAPLLGKTGWMLERNFLPKAGLDRDRISLGNVIRCRVGGQDDLPPLAEGSPAQKAILHCHQAHFRLPTSTRLIVAGGEYAIWWATGEHERFTGGSVAKWRGWLLPWVSSPGFPSRVAHAYHPAPGDIPVLVTQHEAALFHIPWEMTAAASDWNRVGQYLAGKWPEPFPPIRSLAPAIVPAEFSFDAEYAPDTKHVHRWSMAWRDERDTPHVYVVERDHARMRLPKGVKPVVWVHNSFTSEDLDILSRLVEADWREAVEVRDTMVMHHVLWSDLDHTLDYLGSLYARTNYWKPLEHVAPTLYAAGDALGTYDAGLRLARELSRDPGCTRKYRQIMRFLPIIRDAHVKGYRVNDKRVIEVVEMLEAEKAKAQARAQAAAGWPINLGSASQVARQLYDIEQVHLHPETGRRRLWKGQPAV
jgi:uracil-DNA glycosylase